MLSHLDIALIILAYLMGSINSAIIVCKLMGLPSPLSVGSGNPGATNVLRLGNKKAAAITMIGDVLKGIIPVIIGHLLHASSLSLSLIAMAAVIGHIFPIFFKFKGGKGVATTLGVILALNIYLGLAVLATWLVMAIVFRYSSLSSLMACAWCPLYAYFIIGYSSVWPLLVIAIIVIIRHQANIKRLWTGTESKIGQKKV